MQKGTIKDDILRGVTGAGVGFAVVNTLANSSAKVPINVGGMNFTLGTAFPIAVGLGTFLASVSHDYILNHIPHNEKFVNMESAALNAGISGGVPAGLIYFSNKDLMGSAELGKLFVLGAASGGLSTYVYDSYLAPFVGTLSKH